MVKGLLRDCFLPTEEARGQACVTAQFQLVVQVGGQKLGHIFPVMMSALCCLQGLPERDAGCPPPHHQLALGSNSSVGLS